MLFNDSWMRAINSLISDFQCWAVSTSRALTNILDPGWKIKSRFARLFAVSGEFVWLLSFSFTALCDVTPSDEKFTITKIIAMLAMMLFENFFNIFTTNNFELSAHELYNLLDFNWTRSEISSTSGVIDAASLSSKIKIWICLSLLVFVTIRLSSRERKKKKSKIPRVCRELFIF